MSIQIIGTCKCGGNIVRQLAYLCIYPIPPTCDRCGKSPKRRQLTESWGPWIL